MPAAEARRMAAERSGASTYVPTWAPQGFRLVRWRIVVDTGAGNERLVLRFARRGAGLSWQVSDSREVVRRRTGIGCRDRRHAVATVDGRTVFYRERGDVATAWICLRIGYPLTVSVAQRRDRPGAVEAGELQRIVAGAVPLRPGRARGSRYELTPPREVDRLATAFGQPLFLPARLPPGFIFTRWSVVPNDYVGRRVVSARFGRDGLMLVWSVYSGVDDLALACPDGPARIARVIAGRRILFRDGIHGATAWWCVPAGAVGNPEPLEVELWYDIQLHGAAMRRRAMRMVATARLVRPG